MATGWFQKATGVFGRRETPPQPYNFPCDCGDRLTGFRADVPQKPTCPSCGQAHLVLPACLLPVPATLRQQWFGEPIVTPKKKAAAPPQLPVPDKKPRRIDKPVPTPPPVDRATAAAPRAPLLTPARVIVLSIVVTVTVTGLVLWRGARREWAQTHFQPAIDRGLVALQQRDFPRASSAFGEAVRALEMLGRRDAAAQSVRQYQREADVAAQLSVSSASDLLQQVFDQNTGASLAARFHDEAAGQWMVFDAVVDRQQQSDGAERWAVDLPLWFGDEPLYVAFDEFPWPVLSKTATGDKARRIVFAAQWDRLELPSGNDRRMTLMLRSSTAVLWCHLESYNAVTLAPLAPEQEAALRETLAAQRAALGVEAAP